MEINYDEFWEVIDEMNQHICGQKKTISGFLKIKLINLIHLANLSKFK